MGRGRKPAARREDGEPDAGFVPDMPDGMGPRAAAKWLAIVPVIAQQVPLKSVDADALRQYCEAVVLREKAIAELEDAPLLMAGPNGAEYANPLLKIVSQQEACMNKLAERFGLDPASRRRLQIEASKPDAAFTEFMRRAGNRAKPVAG
jgi:P27 family predicted phage terminase small subunit